MRRCLSHTKQTCKMSFIFLPLSSNSAKKGETSSVKLKEIAFLSSVWIFSSLCFWSLLGLPQLFRSLTGCLCDRFFFVLELCKFTQGSRQVEVQRGGCCPCKGLSNLTAGMQHTFSCVLLLTHLLQQTPCSATNSNLSPSADWQYCRLQCTAGTEASSLGDKNTVESSTPIPLCSSRFQTGCTGDIRLAALVSSHWGVFLWESRFESVTF